jgi:hypothetical protein
VFSKLVLFAVVLLVVAVLTLFGAVGELKPGKIYLTHSLQCVAPKLTQAFDLAQIVAVLVLTLDKFRYLVVKLLTKRLTISF